MLLKSHHRRSKVVQPECDRVPTAVVVLPWPPGYPWSPGSPMGPGEPAVPGEPGAPAGPGDP